MQKHKFALLSIILLFSGVSQALAITFEEIAGTYEGWRTETSANGTIRYWERDEILLDGSFYTWLENENGVYAMYSVLTLDEDGNIEGPYAGLLKINGPELQIKNRDGRFSVHAVVHRTE